MLRLKNVLSITVAVIITIFLMQKCNNEKLNKAEGAYKELEKRFNKQKDGVKVIKEQRILVEDSLKEVLNKRDQKINTLKNEVSILQNKKYKPVVVPKDVKGLVEYFNDRYNTKENTFINNKVALTEFVAYDVSFELEEGDNLRELVVDQGQIISKQKEIITETENKVKDKDVIIDFRGKELQAREELQTLAEENIKNLQTQNKKLKRKSTLNKILIPVAILGGGFLGYKIAK